MYAFNMIEKLITFAHYVEALHMVAPEAQTQQTMTL